MAKKSKIAKNEQRKVVVERYAAKRAELKKTLVDENASPVRVRNRDQIDGRPRGTFQRFGISRVRFRNMAHRGELPGIYKSSW